MIPTHQILVGDALEKLREIPPESIQMCVTSPPYYNLRDYDDPRQLGLETTPELYIEHLVEISREVRRVLKKDGTFWLNIGDSYSSGGRANYDSAVISQSSGLRNSSAGGVRHTPGWAKPKDRLMIPARAAIALQADGWYLRDEIVWFKPNPMPESVTDRTTKSHEFIYLLTKSPSYYYDYEAILEPAAYDGRIDTMMKGSEKYATSCVPGQAEHTMAARGHERWPNKLAYKQKEDSYGSNSQPFGSIHAMEGAPARNKRSVWRVPTRNFNGAHFATYPPDLIKPCIMAGSRRGDTVLDCFGGRGTTGEVAIELGRNVILIELNPSYAEMCRDSVNTTPGLL
jgi:DNA modification methylase